MSTKLKLITDFKSFIYFILLSCFCGYFSGCESSQKNAEEITDEQEEIDEQEQQIIDLDHSISSIVPSEICPNGNTLQVYYFDEDGDGIGIEDSSIEACSQPEGYVLVVNDPEPHCATNDTDECDIHLNNHDN